MPVSSWQHASKGKFPMQKGEPLINLPSNYAVIIPVVRISIRNHNQKHFQYQKQKHLHSSMQERRRPKGKPPLKGEPPMTHACKNNLNWRLYVSRGSLLREHSKGMSTSVAKQTIQLFHLPHLPLRTNSIHPKTETQSPKPQVYTTFGFRAEKCR